MARIDRRPRRHSRLPVRDLVRRRRVRARRPAGAGVRRRRQPDLLEATEAPGAAAQGKGARATVLVPVEPCRAAPPVGCVRRGPDDPRAPRHTAVLAADGFRRHRQPQRGPDPAPRLRHAERRFRARLQRSDPRDGAGRHRQRQRRDAALRRDVGRR